MSILSVGVLTRDMPHVWAMMQASGAATQGSLLLDALYSYGRHLLGRNLPTTAFDLCRNRPIPSRSTSKSTDGPDSSLSSDCQDG